MLDFTGQSQITSPAGDILGSAAHDERMVVVEIDPALARNKSMTAANDVFTDRRPEMYGALQ